VIFDISHCDLVGWLSYSWRGSTLFSFAPPGKRGSHCARNGPSSLLETNCFC